MSVATWPVSKHSVHIFSEATFLYSIYEPTTIDGDQGSCVRWTVGQSSDVNGVSTDLDSEDAHTNHRFHHWRSINSWCSSIVIDGMNAHRSVIDKPVSELLASCQVFNKVSLKFPRYHMCNSPILEPEVVILSWSTVRKGMATAGNHGHAQINAVTVKICGPFHPGILIPQPIISLKNFGCQAITNKYTCVQYTFTCIHIGTHTYSTCVVLPFAHYFMVCLSRHWDGSSAPQAKFLDQLWKMNLVNIVDTHAYIDDHSGIVLHAYMFIYIHVCPAYTGQSSAGENSVCCHGY